MADRSWGVRYNDDIYYGRDCECRCGRFSVLDHGYEKQVVGFDESTIPVGFAPPVSEKVGVLVYECPVCFERFWNHASELQIRALAQLSPNWPKPSTRLS